MELTTHPVLKFDSLLPIYNWLYPLSGKSSQQFVGDSAVNAFSSVGSSKGRALYLHIPFCETICSFCPFVRGQYKDAGMIDAYVSALIKEIEIKARFQTLTESPVRAIFFGGGTPSILEPGHIRQLGETLRKHFDLTQLKEFSFEVEVKSVTPERIAAMADIGVTHARFGLQTFSPVYRRLFSLTATVEQIECAAEALSSTFPYLSCDIIYGMNGQTVDDLEADIEGTYQLGLRNIDLYPINNLVTQHKLHDAFEAEDKKPTSGIIKHYMNIFAREAMRERSFLPHNGHGYVRVPEDELAKSPVVTDLYSFVYHEHVYGCMGYDLLGFGTNAISSFSGLTAFNTGSRSEYIRALNAGRVPMSIKHHSHAIDSCRPVSLTLPYHGKVEKARVEWDALPRQVPERLQALVDSGLVDETESTYELTRQGWEWYSCIMYYLLPSEEQVALDTIIRRAKRDEKRHIEPTGLEAMSFGRSLPVV